MILVTGFGPFGDVTDNPSAALARALHGRRLPRHRVVGVELPVSYARGPALTISLASALRPHAVVGFGVARGRATVQVETVARPERLGADVDGVQPSPPPDGAHAREATADTRALADALGADLSDDAGRYVCNAWLYEVAAALPVPVAFVHLPDEPPRVERFVEGIGRWSATLPPRRPWPPDGATQA